MEELRREDLVAVQEFDRQEVKREMETGGTGATTDGTRDEEMVSENYPRSEHRTLRLDQVSTPSNSRVSKEDSFASLNQVKKSIRNLAGGSKTPAAN